MPNESFAPSDYYIMGIYEGEEYFLRESHGIDHSQNHVWSRSPEHKIKGTFHEICDILDSDFHEGELNGIIGVIKKEP